MKVYIDRDECVECGGCESVCSDVFELKEGEKASIVEKYRTGGLGEGEVEDDLISCVEEAEESCPVDVIRIES